MQQAEEIAQRAIRRSARVLTAKQLKEPHIQNRIKGIIKRVLARRGLGLINFELEV